MALSPFRWTAIVITGMMLIVLYAITPPKAREVPPYTREVRRLETESFQAGGRAFIYGEQLRMVQIADSVRRALTPSTQPVIRVTYSGGLSPARKMLMDSILAEASKLVGPPRVGVDVAVVVDTLSRILTQPISSYGVASFQILPESPGQRCVTVIRIGRDVERATREHDTERGMRFLRTDAAVQQALGTCRYYAAFGMPSASVLKWMHAAGASYAYSGSWTTSSARVPEPRYWYAGETGPFVVRHPALIYLSRRGIECMSGDLPAVCDSAVVMRMPMEELVTAGPIVGVRRRMGPAATYGENFGGREDELVAGMVRTLGRERFAQLWTSNDPVPVAFERVSGISLASWVNSWIVEQYGAVQRGPSVGYFSLFVAALLVLVAVLISLQIAERRNFA